MRILLHRADGVTEPWLRAFAAVMPQAQIVVWQEGVPNAPCDYAVLFSPPPGLLDELMHVKAIFVTGAGVDGIMKFNDVLPPVPIVRLGDAGMAVQMAEYVGYAVLRYFRRFDEYEQQAKTGTWTQLPLRDKSAFSVGVMGAGVLGQRVLASLAHYGFPLRAWNRSDKRIDGVECFHGADGLDAFLRGTQVLVCMLPLTTETANLLDRDTLAKLPEGAYLINVGRGAHVAEPDLLTLIRSGHIAGATLDVFRNEPLPGPHPFWEEPRITITPHVAAATLPHESVLQFAHKIGLLAAGEPVPDLVDRQRGY